MPAQPRAGPETAGADADSLRRLRRLARLLDARFGIPGTRWRLGLDSIVGLIPGVGDAAALLPALWIVAEGRRLGARRRTVARMLGNLAIDTALGAVPVVGDLIDVAFKANLRNLRLIERDLNAGRAADPNAH